MKKRIIPLLLALALLLTAACGIHRIEPAQDGGQTAAAPAASRSDAEQPPAEEEEESEPASASEAEAEPAEEPAPETTPAPEGPDGPTRYEAAVTDLEGTDGKLPHIESDCPGAAEINDDIASRFGYLVEDEYCRLWYEHYTGFGGQVLSVLVAEAYDDGFVSYMPYNLDLSTGQRLSGRELIGLLGLDADALSSVELAIMGGEFDYQYGSDKADMGEDVYNEQYGRTTAPENAELDRVWFGDMGQLMFVARIYSLAGAEFYEYPMAAGYVFR